MTSTETYAQYQEAIKAWTETQELVYQLGEAMGISRDELDQRAGVTR